MAYGTARESGLRQALPWPSRYWLRFTLHHRWLLFFLPRVLQKLRTPSLIPKHSKVPYHDPWHTCGPRLRSRRRPTSDRITVAAKPKNRATRRPFVLLVCSASGSRARNYQPSNRLSVFLFLENSIQLPSNSS